MFKTQGEPQVATGKWFQCKVLDILIYGLISMVYKSVDHDCDQKHNNTSKIYWQVRWEISAN